MRTIKASKSHYYLKVVVFERFVPANEKFLSALHFPSSSIDWHSLKYHLGQWILESKASAQAKTVFYIDMFITLLNRRSRNENRLSNFHFDAFDNDVFAFWYRIWQIVDTTIILRLHFSMSYDWRYKTPKQHVLLFICLCMWRSWHSHLCSVRPLFSLFFI